MWAREEVDSLVGHGRLSGVLRLSADRRRVHQHQRLGQPRDRLCRALGQAQEAARGRTLEVETSEVEIVQRCNQAIDQTSAQEVHHVLRRCPALGRAAALALVQVKESARGVALRIGLEPGRVLQTVRVPHSFQRIDFRDSVLPQALERSGIVCRIREPDCKTA